MNSRAKDLEYNYIVAKCNGYVGLDYSKQVRIVTCIYVSK
jgi:hypothetical protein